MKLTNNTRPITYMYMNAFTTCICGNELVLSKQIISSPVYNGQCECGKKFELRDFKIREIN